MTMTSASPTVLSSPSADCWISFSVSKEYLKYSSHKNVSNAGKKAFIYYLPFLFMCASYASFGSSCLLLVVLTSHFWFFIHCFLLASFPVFQVKKSKNREKLKGPGPVRVMTRTGPVFFCKLHLNGASHDTKIGCIRLV